MNDQDQDRRTIQAVFRIEGMADDISEMKVAMREMAQAVAKMALVEERQARDRQDISRAFTTLDSHAIRLQVIEAAQPAQAKTTEWVDKVLWVVINAVLVAVISLVVVNSSINNPTKVTSNTTVVQPK